MGDTEHRIDDPASAPVCTGCRCYRADVANVATDQGPQPLCWSCKHAISAHRIPLAQVTNHVPYRATDGRRGIQWGGKEGTICTHTAAGVYPPDVLRRRQELAEAKFVQLAACFGLTVDEARARLQAREQRLEAEAEAAATPALDAAA
jgi:hypothetical protein